VIGGFTRVATENPSYWDTLLSAANEEYTPIDYGTVVPQSSPSPTPSAGLQRPETYSVMAVTVLGIAALATVIAAGVYFKKHKRVN
jgi:hypothetical protein